jgi:DNA-binding NarL/FixJ family response regulator
MPVRVGIIEDHIDFREGLHHILQVTPGFKSVGGYSSVESALSEMPQPDVLLLDIGLPGMSGIEGLPKLKEKFPDARVIMLTISEEDKDVFRAILNGADGYILKSMHPARLLQAIEDVVKGGTPMTPTIARKALDVFKKYVPTPATKSTLSERETEILSMLVDGLDNDEIADKLCLSSHTIGNHIRHIYEKLHVHSKSQAVVKAIKQGLI